MLFFALALAATPASPPAMVTMVRGPVTLVDGASRTPAPAPPFMLSGAQSLDVGAGGHVVLLRQGGAFAVDGPKLVDPESFRVSSSTDKVGPLLEKHTSLASAGAARGAGPALLRPVPNATALDVTDVRWTCDACGPQEVKIVDLRADAVMFTGRGEGMLKLGATKLPPGTYAVTVGDTERTFRVVPRADADAVLASVHAETIPDPADRASTVAAALLLAGYPTDALSTLEAAGLADQVTAYERLAGVRP